MIELLQQYSGPGFNILVQINVALVAGTFLLGYLSVDSLHSTGAWFAIGTLLGAPATSEAHLNIDFGFSIALPLLIVGTVIHLAVLATVCHRIKSPD